MDIYRHRFIRVTVVILVAAAAGVALRRYSQERQFNQQYTPDYTSVDAKQVSGFLIDNKIDHELYTKLINSYTLEFDIFQAENQAINPSLQERLKSLNDLIVRQLKSDQKWLGHLSDRESQVVADRHSKWEEIQVRINQMADPVSAE